MKYSKECFSHSSVCVCVCVEYRSIDHVMNTNNHIQTITRLLTTKMNVVATATATKSWHFIHYCLNMVRKYAFKNKLQLVLQAPFSIIVTHLSLSHLLWTLLTTLWFEKYLLYDCDALLSFIPYSIRKYYNFFQFLFSCLLALIHSIHLRFFFYECSCCEFNLLPMQGSEFQLRHMTFICVYDCIWSSVFWLKLSFIVELWIELSRAQSSACEQQTVSNM